MITFCPPEIASEKEKETFPSIGNHFGRLCVVRKLTVTTLCWTDHFSVPSPGCSGIDWAPWAGCCQISSATDWPYDHVETDTAWALHSSGEPLGQVLLWSSRGMMVVLKEDCLNFGNAQLCDFFFLLFYSTLKNYLISFILVRERDRQTVRDVFSPTGSQPKCL